MADEQTTPLIFGRSAGVSVDVIFWWQALRLQQVRWRRPPRARFFGPASVFLRGGAQT